MDIKNLDVSLLEEIEAHSVDIARQAGRILLEHYRKPLEVEFKGKKNTDPVTIADKSSEEYLKNAISKKFPDHNILSEEGGIISQSDSPFAWVLDPLDGTSNFMNGLPLFAVSIGVLWGNQPVAGSIFVPVSHLAAGGVYHTRIGNGAFFNDEKITVETEPFGRPLSEIPAQFGGQFRLSGKSRKEPNEARNLGSIALELAMTACGVFQYALFGGPKIWDVSAGILLVKEAGGQIYTRRRRERSWLPLDTFQTGKDSADETMEDLRSWSAPLIAGSPDIARKVVKDIRIHRTPLSWLRSLRRTKVRKSGK
ncbi:inositol monophosphatase family protein [Chloroflexota bacterium]